MSEPPKCHHFVSDTVQPFSLIPQILVSDWLKDSSLLWLPWFSRITVKWLNTSVPREGNDRADALAQPLAAPLPSQIVKTNLESQSSESPQTTWQFAANSTDIPQPTIQSWVFPERLGNLAPLNVSASTMRDFYVKTIATPTKRKKLARELFARFPRFPRALLLVQYCAHTSILRPH
jgi:hypothetical protein